MTPESIRAYFEDLATRHVAIQHTAETPRFARYNIDEVLTGLRASLGLADYTLLLESPEGNLDNNGADQLFDNQTVAFMVVKKAGINDFDAEDVITNQAREICLQLLARIRHDRFFPVMDLKTVEYQKVSCVFGNAHGYRLNFVVSTPLALRYDASVFA